MTDAPDLEQALLILLRFSTQIFTEYHKLKLEQEQAMAQSHRDPHDIIPAFANAMQVTVGPDFVKMVFGEGQSDGIHYHVAVVMPRKDAIEAAELILQQHQKNPVSPIIPAGSTRQ